jgi:hypothetical protein
MAVIQISKIQLRRGQTADQGMPQLASGEMGWSVDEQRLFIGNGSVAEGAPAVGNTEVLTEARMFDLLSTGKFTATNYTYVGHTITATITGVLGANFPVVRTLQEKLDDSVSMFDFGVLDKTDCTAKFQKAIDEIYLRSFDKTLPKSRVPVSVPAGTYYVTGTVYLPPYVTLVGAGIDKTVIRSIGTGNTTIFETIGGNSTPSVRVTGTNIVSPTNPRQIKISGMTLEHTGTMLTTQTTPMIVLNYAADTTISDIKFLGTYVSGATATTVNSAIELGYLSSDLTIEHCHFEDLSYPVVSNWNVSDVKIVNNTFDTLYQGITLANALTTSSGKNIGPIRVDIQENKFINIERQGIFVGANTSTNNQINSENNHFINVGNNGNGDADPAHPIITFASHGNSSTNDNFERLWYMQTTVLDTPQYEIIEGTAQVRLKFTDRQPLPESTSTQTLLKIPYNSTVTSVTIDYTLEKAGLARKGTLSVVASDVGVSYKDSYAVAGSSDGDVVFSAAFLDHGPVDRNDTLTVQYTNPVAAGTGTIIFNVAYYR